MKPDYLLYGDGLPRGHKTEIPAIDTGPTHISIEDREWRRIYGQLVDRLWGCEADANAVFDILEARDRD